MLTKYQRSYDFSFPGNARAAYLISKEARNKAHSANRKGTALKKTLKEIREFASSTWTLATQTNNFVAVQLTPKLVYKGHMHKTMEECNVSPTTLEFYDTF